MDYSGTTQRILRLLLDHRRRYRRDEPLAADDVSAVIAVHGPVIERFVEAGQPLHAVLPAFPCKSPSLNKVLGVLPDMAERQSLIFLDELFDDIAAIHAPGARLTLCSDGRVFADCLGVPDAHVSNYRDELTAICADEGLTRIDFFNLEDVPAYAPIKDDPQALRCALETDFGVLPEDMRAVLLARPEGRAFYAAVTRFLFEDLLPTDQATSRTRHQKQARSRALWTICRSEAWGRLLAAHWPDALRLSIHPQAAGAAKLGLRLLDTPDDWLTPWHATLLDDRGHHRLVHRHSVDAATVIAVEHEGRPSHVRRPTLSEVVSGAGQRDQPDLRALPGAPLFGGMLIVDSMQELPDAASLRSLVRRHGLLLIRGLPAWSQQGDMETFCRRFGRPLVWPSGVVVEVAEQAGATDHVNTASSMPMHWDGMYLPVVPELQVFTCRSTSLRGGGRTLFAYTPGVLHASDRDSRESWECTTGIYGRHTEDYAGRVRAPLVQRHLLHGYPVLRYCGAAGQGVLNPGTRRFNGGGADAPTAMGQLDAALMQGSFVYAHDWHEGDIVMADNMTLLHAREAFVPGGSRCLWRVHIHGPETATNPDLVRGVHRFAEQSA